MGYGAAAWNSTKVQQPATDLQLWSEMTEEQQAALLVLGYSERTWDRREPHSTNMYWRDLSSVQQTGAELLGYRASKWNDRKGNANPPDHVGKAWEELTDDEQVALEILGFTQTLWDEGTFPRPHSYFKSWDQLTTCGEIPSFTR